MLLIFGCLLATPLNDFCWCAYIIFPTITSCGCFVFFSSIDHSYSAINLLCPSLCGQLTHVGVIFDDCLLFFQKKIFAYNFVLGQQIHVLTLKELLCGTTSKIKTDEQMQIQKWFFFVYATKGGEWYNILVCIKCSFDSLFHVKNDHVPGLLKKVC